MADITGDGRADIVGFGNAGTWLATGRSDGTFNAKQFVMPDFGYDQQWRVDQHPRYLTDITGDGRADIVGFGATGVHTAVATSTSWFHPSFQVTDTFGYNGGWRVNQHPRLLGDVTGDGLADIVGFGHEGVYLAPATGSGFFGTMSFVMPDFGYDQLWRVEQHPRFLADIIGFGHEGVYTAVATGSGFFGGQRYVNDFYGFDSNWRVNRQPRLIADVTGDGRADIIGFDTQGVVTSCGRGDGSFD